MDKAVTAYSTIQADPPWPERGGGKIKRGADRHYPLLKIDDIPRVMLTSPLWKPAQDAHLYLWVTDNYLPDGIWVMRQLGFRYVRTLPWIKLKNEAFNEPDEGWLEWKTPAGLFEGLMKFGIGQYFRGASELLLFGVRGTGYNVCTERKDLCNVIIGPRGKHSKKPDAAYDLIEARSKGPYLEIFARTQREGWDSWGNELPVC